LIEELLIRGASAVAVPGEVLRQVGPPRAKRSERERLLSVPVESERRVDRSTEDSGLHLRPPELRLPFQNGAAVAVVPGYVVDPEAEADLADSRVFAEQLGEAFDRVERAFLDRDDVGVGVDEVTPVEAGLERVDVGEAVPSDVAPEVDDLVWTLLVERKQRLVA
jgi:hypothetical protein